MTSPFSTGEGSGASQEPAAALLDASDFRIDQLPLRIVPIADLAVGHSPRLAGHDEDHVTALAQCDTPLPPILVHGPTMRVIDGRHRVQAAKLRNDEKIEVRLFDGDENAAFVLAVRTNIAHGLPLTLADRTAAATRILATYPHWSDRAIARAVALAASTVAAIRERTNHHSEQPNSRLGRDGKQRPLSTAEARRRASLLIRENPQASLRQIAGEVGISTATARDVRKRMAHGLDPVPAGQREDRRTRRLEDLRPRPLEAHRPRARRHRTGNGSPPRSPDVILELLRKDPSLRSSDAGRALLKWLTLQVRHTQEWETTIDRLPPHSFTLVAEALQSLMHTWNRLADGLEQRK
ncbi:ParB/RepB/Spo0J family partition protein [Spirillospora sp. NBC_00431]